MGGDRLYRVIVKIHWNEVDIYRIVKNEIGYTNRNPSQNLTYTFISYEFWEDKLKKELLSVLFRIVDIDKLPGDTALGDFLIEDINFDIIKLLAAKDITKDGEFRGKVKRYLRGDMDLEEFHKEVVAYCVAEKLSQ